LTPSSAWFDDPASLAGVIAGMVSDGATPTASGIAAAAANNPPGSIPPRPKLLFIITDGEPNVVLGGNLTSVGGLNAAAYQAGTTSAIQQADAARAGGWNTAAIRFGPGDNNSPFSGAQVSQILAGLAGNDIGGPAGDVYQVVNAAAL